MLMYFKEASKYEPDSGESGPLQGDRNLPKIQKETNDIFIDPVFGIEKEKNMLISIGLKINKEGLIEIDEDKLTNSINENLSVVANLFRSWGAVDNSGIIYLSSTEKSQISGPNGYSIDLTGAASKGFYSTKPIAGTITIDDTNNELFVNVNGRESESITLEPGVWRVDDVARDLQKKIINDKSIGKMKAVVTAENGSITIRSNSTGSKSSVYLRLGDTENILKHPLMGGVSKAGTDVQGTINGEAMTGSGQILSGNEGTPYEGLKLYVSLTDNQIGNGLEGNIVFTKGVGTKVQEYIEAITSPEKGALDIYTNNVKKQLDNYVKELSELEQRIVNKRQKLSEKFAKMESQLGQLKNEQKYLTGELAKLQ
jgi:flagellar hook-associated protein 2